MISHLPVFWQIMAVMTVITLSYPMALMLNGLMGQDGFGTIPHMAIVSIGFFTTLYVCDVYGGQYGIRLYDLQEMIIAGTVGATAISFMLALMKVALSKL